MLVVAVLFWQITLIAGTAPAMAATPEDVAMFHDELAQYGAWVNYGKYGQVWYPTRVSENWRPYVDGRWVPSDDGWIFETDEPWGWATYHFGNWMPTEEYGWVWVPGSTWYPATAAWRTNDDYIGWAPVPPPDYVPVPAFAPVGYYPGMPFLDLISPPFWTFCPASRFLLGFGLPFAPIHSFHNCGCLAPFNFIPALFPRTAFLHDFFFPAFAPKAFFFFGPRFQHVALATNISIIKINNFAGTVNINILRNVVPPQVVLTRRPFLRETIPAAVWEGRKLEIRRAANVHLAERNLNRPDIARSARPVFRPEREAPEVIRGLHQERSALAPEVIRGRGMRLPPQAVQEPRVMQQQMRGQRQLERQTLPRAQQQRLLREEQMIRRQEVFRPRQPHRRVPGRAPSEIFRGQPPSGIPRVQPKGEMPRGRMGPRR
jgi:hypothetical protein